MPVYLIHFERRYHHAGHYLGYSRDLEARIRAHQLGNGARLMEVIGRSHIPWRVVRVWEGDRSVERALKDWHAGPRLCPVCHPAQGRRKDEMPVVPHWTSFS